MRSVQRNDGGAVTDFELQATVASVLKPGDLRWQSLPLKRDGLGAWKVLLPLPKGAYYYSFEVDGVRTLDPKSPEKAQSAGRECSVRQVP